jgi:hypothetical protein
MIWTGADAPKWLYQDLHVPKVNTDDSNHNQFPYYYDPVYKQRWFNMLDAVSAHVDALPDSVRKKIIIYQSAEGTTGDEGPYKGNISRHDSSLGYIIDRSDAAWIQFRQNAWDSLYQLYSVKTPIIHLLVNCDPSDPEDASNWIHDNIPRTWRKANDEGHGYQLNNEAQKKADYDPLVKVVNTPLTPLK